MGSETPKFKLLNNTNYGDWSGEMRAWLMKLGYWRLVNGKERKPSDSSKLDEWEEKAEKAAGEIFLAVEPEQRVLIKDMLDDPVKMWLSLETAHVSKKAGARFNAYSDLLSITKHDDESLNDLGVRVANAMSLVKNLRPKDYTIEQLDEDLQCMALIRALSNDYATLSTSLLLVDSLDKDKFLQAFRAEELNRQRKSETAAPAQAQASRSRHNAKERNSNYNGSSNATGNNGNSNNQRNNNGSRNGSWNNFGSGNNSNGNNGGTPRFNPKVTCYYCGGVGHFIGYCPSNPNRITGQQSGGSQQSGGYKANKADANNVVESAGNASIVSRHAAYSTGWPSARLTLLTLNSSHLLWGFSVLVKA